MVASTEPTSVGALVSRCTCRRVSLDAVLRDSSHFTKCSAPKEGPRDRFGWADKCKRKLRISNYIFSSPSHGVLRSKLKPAMEIQSVLRCEQCNKPFDKRESYLHGMLTSTRRVFTNQLKNPH